jgi:predicted site-specific integrase-resolvase
MLKPSAAQQAALEKLLAEQQDTAFRAGLYARVSTNDQQTLPMQSRALRQYAARRGWTIAVNVREVGSSAAQRESA